MDGKATAAPLGFVARKLDIHTRANSLIAGEKSRDKVIAVEGVEPAEARRHLLQT